MNLTLELTTEQIIDLVQQMPPEEKLTVLKALAKEARAGRAERMKYAESRSDNYAPNADWIGTR